MSTATPSRAPARARLTRRSAIAVGLILALAPAGAWAADRAELERDGKAALDRLYASTPKAAELGAKARAVLIFPKIVKAGFMVGAQTGDGVLLTDGRPTGFYNISAGSFGLQAGAQKFSYVMFFMTQDALDYLAKSKGWAFGSGPSIVVLDEGKARTMNTTTLTEAVYAMTFGQEGLMGGLGMEGSKITPIQPD